MPVEALTASKSHISVARWIVAAYGVVVIAMSVHFLFYLRYALSAVQFPFQLDYGEGIIWQQALLIPGERMYGDITRFPFLVFHYPPLYHLAVRAIAAFGGDMLMAGRGLSLFCTLVTGGLVATVTFDVMHPRAGRTARLIGAAVAGLMVFCYWPVVFWSPYMRVDMLAVMLSFLGIWLAGRSSRNPLLLYLAVLSFVCAVYTRQTSVAAPLAVMLVSLLVARRHALAAFGFGLLVGLIVLFVMDRMSDGGFLRHLLLYNLNRISLPVAVSALCRQSAGHAVCLVMTLGGLAAGWRALADGADWRHPALLRARLQQSAAARLMAMLTLWLAFSTLMLATLGKSGANLNYFIEWMCVGGVMIGVLVASGLVQVFAEDERRDAATASGKSSRSALLVPMVLLAQIVTLPAGRDFGDGDHERMAQRNALVARIRDATLPVLSDDMVLLLKAGKPVPWEPAIFAELAATGVWDERPAVDMIIKHAFAFIITEGHPGDLVYDTQFTPAMDRAIREVYPRIEEFGGRTLHYPSQNISAPGPDRP